MIAKVTMWNDRREAVEMAIEALSANDTTEKPKDVVEQKNDVVAEPTDLISRAEVLDIIAFKRKLANIDGRILLDEIEDRINALPSAEAVKVAYICDGRKCDADCSDCFRTLDIEHAKDFKLMGSVYYQQESADRPSGEWQQVETIDDDEPSGINTDASQCSVCGVVQQSHYWATHYYNYCPNCGAKMGGNK